MPIIMQIKAYARVAPCVLLLVPFLLSPAAQTETPESRGRQIYLRGLSPSGREITAILGHGGTEVSASVVPCASCHGLDGRGKAEGGVFPSAIRWLDLTRPYEVVARSGRKHPAYNESLLVRAMTMGIDSAGNTLDDAMPRYRLSQEDAKDLTVWLKRLGAPDPGLTDTSIEIGVFVSGDSRLAAINTAAKDVLDTYFDELNRNGGVYGRRIVLRYREEPESPGAFETSFKQFLSGDSPFLLINSYIAGSEDAAAKILQNEGVPLIGPITLYPALQSPLNRYIFYLDSGVLGQVLALRTYAERKFSAQNGPAVVVYSDNGPVRGVAEAIHQQGGKRDWTLSAVSDFSGDARRILAGLKKSGTSVVLLLSPAALSEQLLAAARSDKDWNPVFLVPGSLATKSVFDAAAPLEGRVIFAVPSSPSDYNKGEMAAYQKLAQAHSLPDRHLATQLAALAEATILHEALVRAGHDLSREKVIEALEGIYDFQTGAGPPVSFGPNRRTGSDKARLAVVDARTGGLRPLTE